MYQSDPAEQEKITKTNVTPYVTLLKSLTPSLLQALEVLSAYSTTTDYNRLSIVLILVLSGQLESGPNLLANQSGKMLQWNSKKCFLLK